MPSVRPVSEQRLRDAWWLFALVLVALGLFTAGFLVRLHCGGRPCGGLPRLLDLEAVGGLPRLFTTAVFAAVGALALRAARSRAGAVALWWTAVGVGSLVLALAKLVSVHSELKAGAPPVLQLVVGLAVAVPALGLLWLAGRRGDVPGCTSVVVALGAYAAAALGLDVVTHLAVLVQEQVGLLTMAAGSFVEELAEALTALLLLAVVHRQTASPRPWRQSAGHRTTQGRHGAAPQHHQVEHGRPVLDVGEDEAP